MYFLKLKINKTVNIYIRLPQLYSIFFTIKIILFKLIIVFLPTYPVYKNFKDL